MKRKRTISDYIAILTYLWVKWIDNHNTSNNAAMSYQLRRASGERCERIQAIRQKAIKEFNRTFDKIIKI